MKTIGSILLDVELVTQEDIERALELQKQTGQRLGEVLVNLGVVSDDDIRWALAEQLNLPYVNIRKDQIDAAVATMIPEKLARRYHVIPILKIDDELTVVVDDPLNTTIIKDIEAITRCRVKISLGRTSDIVLAIDEIYGSAEEDFRKQQDMPPQLLSAWFGEEDMQKILNDPSGHALLQSVLAHAFTHGVARIYFQPGFQTCHISYRIHGVIQPQVQLGKEWYSIALFRLKISGGFELSKARQPQYQEFSYWDYVGDKQAAAIESQVKVAASIFPTTAGEAAVLQIMNKAVEKLAVNERQTPPAALQDDARVELSKLKTTLPHLQTGAIFLAGAPYADKITTLYDILEGFDPIRKKIATLEAYTEYGTDKYTQIRYFSEHLWEASGVEAVKRPEPAPAAVASHELYATDRPPAPAKDVKKAAAFNAAYHSPQELLASWLAMLTTYDADVLLVDRIESAAVLSQCMDYAAQHLLFGAFDFDDVFEILAYCLDCQVKPSMLVSRVFALLAQHSVHLLCPECKQPDVSDAGKELLARLPAAAVEKHQAYLTLFAPKGCPACHGTGYVERIVLFEVLKMAPWLQKLLLQNTPLAEIRAAAIAKGFSSIKQKSSELLLTGQTSIEQILAIIT